MATVYRRKSSPYWWMQYTLDGNLERESTGLRNRRDAERYCEQRMLEISLNKMQYITNQNISWEQLKTLVLDNYKFKKRKSTSTLLYRMGTLDKYFKGLTSSSLTPLIPNYIKDRMKEVSHNTIQRELAIIKRAFNLAKKQGLIWKIPYIPHLEDKDNIRQGFLHHHLYEDLIKALPEYLRGPTCLAYHTGMRQGEIFNLVWSKIDSIEDVIWLAPPDTKNKYGRFVPIPKELKVYLKLAGKRLKGLPWVWLNRLGNGKIKDIRYPWKKATAFIGKPDFLFHDLRRCGARNMLRSGIPRGIVMAIGGWKTESVFERYNIVDDTDIHRAMRLQEKFLEKQRKIFRSKVWKTAK